jgi:hypothetical protein
METQENFAPYAPTENVLRVLSKARSGGLRGPIDVPYLTQLGIEQSMAPRSVRALRFLGLIQDDGNPTSLMEQYIQASDEESQTLLRGAIERSYALVLRAANPESDTRAKVFNAFRMMKPQGQWDRMVTLFLGLCRAAGMDVKEAPPSRSGRLDSPREARSPRPRPRATPSKAPGNMRWSIEGQGDKRFFQEMVDARSPSTEALDPAIVAFLGRLRSINSIEDLDTWYQALKPLFAYVLTTRPKPVQEPASSSDPAS